ncbi:MAG: ribosome silencing factor [Actinobacteria bacterium]|nr:ribosome silencing factor [Actinomycetota bacterium]
MTIWWELNEHGGSVVERSVEMARVAAEAIFSKKGVDIVLLDVEDAFFLTDVFVIATGSSRPHVQALAEYVEERVAAVCGVKPLRVEGENEGEWVLIDFGDVIVHIFQAGPREYYSLERLWGDAERIRWEEPVVIETPTEF